MSAFAFTNGWVSNLCAIQAPASVPAEKRGQVGAFVGTTITLGILMGCVVALGMGPVIALAPEAPAVA